MRSLLTVGIILFAGLAVAEREARTFEVKRLEVDAADGRIVATPKGFVALERGKGGFRIVNRDRDGKELAELARAEGTTDAWWAAPEGGAAAYLNGDGDLSIETPGEKGGPAGHETESFAGGEAAFSRDGDRIAFCPDEKVVVAREAKPKGWRVEIPSSSVREGPLWSGDGKSLVVVTGAARVVNGVLETSPDTVSWCDPKAAQPAWTRLFHSDGGTIVHLAADLTGRRVVFVEQKGGWKLRLFDLDKGELDVLDESGGTRSVAFTPAGDVLVTADTRAGRVEAWLIGTVRGGTKNGIPRDRLGDLPDDDVDAAVAAAGDIWLVTHATPKVARKVVRLTPK